MLTRNRNIDALPESYPREKGEDEEELERYQVLRARLVRGCEVLEGQRRKRDYYGRLRDLAKPFGNPVENVQPNLVTKDGKLHGELERTRMLAVRLAAEVESAGERGFGKKEEGEEEEVDVDMDDDAEEEEWRRKVAGLLEGMS